MDRMIIRLVRDESGATAIEYGLIAALIAVIAITGFGLMGSSLRALFNNTSNSATNVWNNAG